MNDCVNAEIRDALPDLVNGRLGDLDAVTLSEHVASCAGCREEIAILREARANAAIVPALDIERIAAAVAPYAGAQVPATSPIRQSTFTQFRAWKLATVAALIAVGGWVVVVPVRDFMVDSPPVSQTASAASPRSEAVAEIPVSPSAAIAPSPAPLQVASLPLVAGVRDLSDAELEQLLVDLDGIEVIPSEEPASVTLPLDELGGLE